MMPDQLIGKSDDSNIEIYIGDPDRQEEVFGGSHTCALCGVESAGSEPDWRCIELDINGKKALFYMCPVHFPGKDGTVDEFKDAYAAALSHIYHEHIVNRQEAKK